MSLDPSELSDLERLAGLGLTQSQIADWFGFSERTLRDRLNSNEEAVAAYKKGRARALEKVTKRLWDNIEEGDSASIFFYLKTQGGWRETDPNAVSDPLDTANQIMTFIAAAKAVTVSGVDDDG